MVEHKGVICVIRKQEVMLIKHPMEERYHAYLPQGDKDFKKTVSNLEKAGHTVLLVGLQELSEKDSS